LCRPGTFRGRRVAGRGDIGGIRRYPDAIAIIRAAGDDWGSKRGRETPAANRRQSRRENVSRHKEGPEGVVKRSAAKIFEGGYRSRPRAAVSRAVSVPWLPCKLPCKLTCRYHFLF